MTPDDLDQIGALIAAAGQHIAERQESSNTAAEQRFTERQNRAVETIAGELSRQREESNAHFADVGRRLDRLTEQIRLANLASNATNQWAERLDKDQAALGQNYFRQQRAIEELTRRVEALEKRAS